MTDIYLEMGGTIKKLKHRLLDSYEPYGGWKAAVFGKFRSLIGRSSFILHAAMSQQ